MNSFNINFTFAKQNVYYRIIYILFNVNVYEVLINNIFCAVILLNKIC